MKKLLAICSLVSIAGAAQAQGHGQFQNTTPEHLDRCAAWGRFAELAMTAHQEGRPMADQMKLSPDPRAYELIFAAYQTERFSSKIGQERAAAAYRDKIFADCITTLSGQTETDGDRQEQFWTIDKPAKNSANP